MVKHNNVVPNGHFHKDWMRFVKTWLNQPARKQRRRKARAEKLARTSPNPLKTLRPLVQGQTIRYCTKTKKGRGFSLQELKKAGLSPKFARTIGISVDHRRKNKSAETLEKNIKELQFYKSRIVLKPLRPGKPKKGQVPDSLAS